MKPSQAPRATAIGYVVALASVVAATVARWLLDPALGDHLPYVTYFVAVAFVAWFCGLGPSIFAMLVGSYAAEFFFFSPRYELNPYRLTPTHIAGTATYFMVNAWSIFVCQAMNAARHAAETQREALRVTLASIGDAVITTDNDGRITYLNAVAELVTGWQNSEAVGRMLDDVFRIVNEQTRQTAENPATRALREGAIVGLANHTVLIRKDGTETPIDDSASPIRDEQGDLTGVVLIFRDVADRRRAARALQESESRKAAILQTALDSIITIDHQGRVLEFNTAAELLFGYRRDYVLGREMAELIIPPELREQYRRGMAHFLKTGEGPLLNRRYEITAIRADGSEFPVEISITPSGDGDSMTFTGHIRDITERQQMQQSERRLAAIVETSDDAIVSKTLDGIIRTWNAGAERIFGYTAEQAVGQPITLIIPPERAAEEERIIARLKSGQRIDHFDTVRVRSDGRTVQVSICVSPLKDDSGRVIGASKIARDITERKRMENELRKTAADLSEADRRKNEFLAMLAHELRNPLAPIRNAVQILQLAASGDQQVAASETVQSAAEMMERQIGQMVRLIDDLLDVSRVSRGAIELRRERVELGSIVHHAVEAARALVECKHQELTVSMPPEPIYLDADPTRIAQVIGNLLNNACKFTDKGGRINLEVVPVVDESLRDSESPGYDSFVEIRVRDSGIGIDPGELPRIFDLFTQVDTSLERSTSGLGIGLTLVKNLVEMHGGSVEARSEGIGKGSEFIVRLPTVSESAGPMPKTSTRDERPVVPRRILVVDDNQDAANSLATLLRLSGHETQTAHDGQQAIHAADTFMPDVVLLDIGLPKLNGYEAAKRLRNGSRGKDLVLIALTGWGQEDDRRKSAEAGFDAHLVKPVDFAALKSLLADHRPPA